MPNRNASPKQRFLESKKAVQAHNELFSTDAARLSIDMALLQYQTYLTGLDSPPAELYNRIRGAQELVGILMNLGESPTPPKSEPKGNLIH